MNSSRATQHKQSSAIDRLAGRLFATSVQIERGAILFRLIAALPLAYVMFASRERLPYWEVAIEAVVVMFAVNVWLRFENNSNRLPPERSALIGSLVDTIMLLVVSFLAIRASADLSTTSEMWLIFPLVIMAFVYRSKMAIGIAYAALLTIWYSANILIFFDSTDDAVTELPIRATFFMLMGILAAILGRSLRQQSSE
ncbi:hypothetical protein JYU04_01960 [Dehalococcoides mccartyi]|nr:hypothetical protein [Dehalococcoides mccartyi]